MLVAGPKAEEGLPWSRNRAPLPPRREAPKPEAGGQRRREREPLQPLPQPGPDQVQHSFVEGACVGCPAAMRKVQPAAAHAFA